MVCAGFSLLFLITPEPTRNATNALIAEDVIKEVELAIQQDNEPSHEQKLLTEPGDLPRSTPESFTAKVRTIFSNKCFCYLCAAGAFRFMGGYSLGFLSASFFVNRYPDYVNEYGFMGAFVVIGGGLPASMIGGYLGDKFEKDIGGIKSYISGIGALTALPFILVTYLLQPPFWIAIVSYYVAFFLAEMWYGPAHAQINNMFPSEY